MTLHKLTAIGILGGSLVVAAQPSSAGGLFLPGSGAISTSRAGAAVASADDGEALSINPAGLAKTEGWTITISAALIKYSMQFTRSGTYDTFADDAQDYEGTPFPTVKNDPKPPLGIGQFQPIPVIAIVSDLGGRVPNLTVAAGLYAPSGYPFRDMSQGYEFQGADGPALATPPPPTRYDVMTAESMLLFPSIAAAYSILPGLDVGARLSIGRAKSKNVVVVHATPGNLDESVRNDSLFTAEVADGYVPAFGIGATYRPTPNLEFGAVWNSAANLRTSGTAQSIKGPGADPTKVVGPFPDDPEHWADARPGGRCGTGGDFEKQRACISLQLPMSANVGARYKFLAEDGETLRGDIELNVGWENWGKRCDFTSAGYAKDPDCTSPGQFLVEIDSGIYVDTNGDGSLTEDEFTQPLQVNFVNLGLQDTYSVRLGGSLHLPLPFGVGPTSEAGADRVVLRGGIGYDTAAARDGWLRASFDGASRLTTTLGGGFRTSKWEINAGAGMVLEGTNENAGTCNPTSAELGCVGDGSQNPIEDRTGPDPTNPLLTPETQFESPFNQGTIKSHYLLFMLGFSAWF